MIHINTIENNQFKTLRHENNTFKGRDIKSFELSLGFEFFSYSNNLIYVY